MHPLVEAAVTIALAVIGLGVVSVIVSRNANTAGVIQAGASALGNDIAAAQAPVTGSRVTANLNYPSNDLSYGFGG